MTQILSQREHDEQCERMYGGESDLGDCSAERFCSCCNREEQSGRWYPVISGVQTGHRHNGYSVSEPHVLDWIEQDMFEILGVEVD